MSRRRLVVLGTLSAGVLSACAALLGVDDGIPRSDAGAPDAAPVDAPIDAPIAADAAPEAARTTCAPGMPFGAPTPLSALNVPGVEDSHGRLSPDELTIYFSSARTGGSGSGDLYTAKRAKRTDPFGAPTNLGAVINAATGEIMPSITGDGLTLYFVSDRAFGAHVWYSTRASLASAFTAPQVATGLVAAANDLAPYVLPDNASILLESTRQNDAGLSDLFSADKIDGGFSVPVALKGVNTVAHNDGPGAMTPDELVLYFSSDRAGGKGGLDIYVTTRTNPNNSFGPATLVAELNTAGVELADWISADRCRLYFSSTKAANSTDHDLFVAERTP